MGLIRLRGIPVDQPFAVGGRTNARFIPSDSFIAAQLYWVGIEGYEAGGPEWWSALVECHTSVLELGGNIGLYTVIGAQSMPRPRRYRVIEANPLSCEVLRQNLSVNGLDDVEVVAAAVVGDRMTETVELHLPDRDAYPASLIAYVGGAEDIDRPARRSVAVPAVRAPDLVDGVDLVKLDIEGLENEVLMSVRSWITSTSPTLLVEVNDGATTLQSFLAELIPQVGYACAVIADRDSRPQRITTAEATAGRLQAKYGRPDLTLSSADVVDQLIADW